MILVWADCLIAACRLTVQLTTVSRMLQSTDTLTCEVVAVFNPWVLVEIGVQPSHDMIILKALPKSPLQN